MVFMKVKFSIIFMKVRFSICFMQMKRFGSRLCEAGEGDCSRDSDCSGSLVSCSSSLFLFFSLVCCPFSLFLFFSQLWSLVASLFLFFGGLCLSQLASIFLQQERSLFIYLENSLKWTVFNKYISQETSNKFHYQKLLRESSQSWFLF